MQSNSSPNPSSDLADELSLLDIIEFIQESWKTIFGFTVLGIAGAALYLSVVPKQFEASAQIKMAQIANFNSSINSLGINIEEPQALIARMALPTSYPKETIALCGLTDSKDPEAQLARKVRLSIPKGVSGVVDLKIRDPSRDTARACTNAIYQLIKASQAELAAPYVDEASKRLAIEEGRLRRASQVIVNADKSGAPVSAVYFAIRDEIRYLLDQISNLQNIVAGNESRYHARLIAPIYLKEEPVSPLKRNSLAVGLLIGGLLGLAIALVRRWYRSDHAAFKR